MISAVAVPGRIVVANALASANAAGEPPITMLLRFTFSSTKVGTFQPAPAQRPDDGPVEGRVTGSVRDQDRVLWRISSAEDQRADQLRPALIREDDGGVANPSCFARQRERPNVVVGHVTIDREQRRELPVAERRIQAFTSDLQDVRQLCPVSVA